MRNIYLRDRVAGDINKIVGKILRDLGNPAPPLRLEQVRELLKLDRPVQTFVCEVLMGMVVAVGWGDPVPDLPDICPGGTPCRCLRFALSGATGPAGARRLDLGAAAACGETAWPSRNIMLRFGDQH